MLSFKTLPSASVSVRVAAWSLLKSTVVLEAREGERGQSPTPSHRGDSCLGFHSFSFWMWSHEVWIFGDSSPGKPQVLV